MGDRHDRLRADILTHAAAPSPLKNQTPVPMPPSFATGIVVSMLAAPPIAPECHDRHWMRGGAVTGGGRREQEWGAGPHRAVS